MAQVGGELLYHYDFGDDWEHRIVVENAIANSSEVVVCAGGERACPPEDCGGPPGYANLCRVLANRSDPEHASMKRWAGPRFNPGFLDPEAFTAPDKDYPDRFVLIGVSRQLRVLFVVSAEAGDRIRIITARKASPAQRKVYENGP